MATENESSSVQQHSLHDDHCWLTSPVESAASAPLQVDKLHQSCLWFASYMSVFCQIRALLFFYDVRHKSDFTHMLFFLCKLVDRISFCEFLHNCFNFCDSVLRNVPHVM